MLLARLAGRPASGERLTAVIAEDEAPQREVGVDILACGSLGVAAQAYLNFLEGLEADKSFVMPLAQGHAPIRCLDHTRINWTGQDIMDSLVADFTVRKVFRKFGLVFKKAFDLHLRLEPTTGIAFQCFLNDGGIGFITDKQLSMTAGALVAIADGSLKHPIAVLTAGTHPVDGLLAIFLPLMLGHRCQKIFHKLRVGILSELDRGAFKDSARTADRRAEFQMRFQSPREAADIVDYDCVRVCAVAAQKTQHILHAGARGQSARCVIAEHFDNLIALIFRVVAASRFLRAEAIALRCLLGGGHPAVNYGLARFAFVFLCSFHTSYLSDAFRRVNPGHR